MTKDIEIDKVQDRNMDNTENIHLDSAGRLHVYLRNHPEATTDDIRQQCRITNPTETARTLNARLERLGRSERVYCEMKPAVAPNGRRTRIGVWRLHDVV